MNNWIGAFSPLVNRVGNPVRGVDGQGKGHAPKSIFDAGTNAHKRIELRPVVDQNTQTGRHLFQPPVEFLHRPVEEKRNETTAADLLSAMKQLGKNPRLDARLRQINPCGLRPLHFRRYGRQVDIESVEDTAGQRPMHTLAGNVVPVTPGLVVRQHYQTVVEPAGFETVHFALDRRHEPHGRIAHAAERCEKRLPVALTLGDVVVGHLHQIEAQSGNPDDRRRESPRRPASRPGSGATGRRRGEKPGKYGERPLCPGRTRWRTFDRRNLPLTDTETGPRTAIIVQPDSGGKRRLRGSGQLPLRSTESYS